MRLQTARIIDSVENNLDTLRLHRQMSNVCLCSVSVFFTHTDTVYTDRQLYIYRHTVYTYKVVVGVCPNHKSQHCLINKKLMRIY